MLFDVIKNFLSNAWTMVDSFVIPGTELRLSSLLLGLLLVDLGLKLLGSLLGFSFSLGGPVGAADQARSIGVRGARLYRTKIDARRANDER